ncbi:InlB B-repeat-containing protein [Anaerostipes sp.]|uniref:InlB B-repeat-containing protein n=1 Tax=Anaerostipes sp. TaxID=1872530 RepID=UPI0025BD6F6E|nr:InlB B-repeat-containing protein [Anaerostipes sp.]MBS7009657.1 InlB B-repeat-containing protein [Anaerostipes sp.]
MEIQTAEKANTEQQEMPTAERKSVSKEKQKKGKSKKLAENGQTFLDISKGDIRITANGATGGGLSENETELNPKGYWITGKTSDYNIEVKKNVTTEITMEDVSVTSGTSTARLDSMNVSHANVTITLKGKNELICDTEGPSPGNPPGSGGALAKDGMDGSLTIQCEQSQNAGHRCDDKCGSLLVKATKYHGAALGSTLRNSGEGNDSGFANLTIHGGNIDVSGGGHMPGIGSACVSEQTGGGYTKNINITGGIIKAVGTTVGSGIGSGYGNKVNGIYITGGYVEAYGGPDAPGIGASKGDSKQSMLTQNIKISGGDTVVIAVGDEDSGMPGIGSAAGNTKVSNVTAVPDFGYQGYIQDGTALDDYTFVDGTPFKQAADIQVGRFYTKVYFGPFRDTNEIEKDTKDQIGANHVISKTGGQAFSEDQLKGLTMVTGKNENGKDFLENELSFTDQAQIEAINRAKTKGETGEYPLTFQTPNGTKTTVTVYLKGDGTDAAQMNPDKLEPTIGADGFWQDTGGEAFTEDDVRKLAQVQGKNEEGTTYPQENFGADTSQLEVINEAKTAGKGGTFELTFTSPDGKKATVEVVLKAYDETAVNETTGEQIKGLDIISKTGGKAFTKEQLLKLSDVAAQNGDGDPIAGTDLVFPDEKQIRAINEAKTGGKTGDFPLTIETPDGTGITIHVYLRDGGTDQIKNGEDEEKKGSLGANHITQPTGGNAFSEEEIIELCKAKGKNKYGNNVAVGADRNQLNKINEAKTEGRTGEFKLTFSMDDGVKAEVTVTLTGDHTVNFDPNGGDYQPKDQLVVGGRPAVEPKEPKKEGYIFEGWYYTDEKGNEVKWDFDTPVHQSMTLKAKWKKELKETGRKKTTTEKIKTTKVEETTKKNGHDENWNYREIKKDKTGTRAAKTGDKAKLPWVLGCMAGASGIMACLLRRKKVK